VGRVDQFNVDLFCNARQSIDTLRNLKYHSLKYWHDILVFDAKKKREAEEKERAKLKAKGLII